MSDYNGNASAAYGLPTAREEAEEDRDAERADVRNDERREREGS